jgi:hypothetical protein
MTNYERVDVMGVPVIYPAKYHDSGMAMAEAVEKTIAIVTEHWHLAVPKGCEVHVLTDLDEFVDQTVPKSLYHLVNLTKPLWQPRAQRAFTLAGGWMLPWPGCLAVGVKPPELVVRSTSRLGERLFVAVSDPLEKVQHLTCHELTHACTAHLRLPPWLNEGLAMRTVDHMVGYPTILETTRAMVQFDQSVLSSRAYRRIKPNDYDSLIRLYATGYWVTCQLEESHPTTLGELLKRKRSIREVTRIVGTTLNTSLVDGFTA